MTSEKASNDRLFDTGSVIAEKWVLIERVGKGGMGEVYRAHQLNLNRDVAIKVISEDILQDIEENPEEVANAMQRLQIEVQTMAQVRHQNVLQIYDYGSVAVQQHGSSKKVQYIAMEYVPGNTFRYTMSEEGFDDETELLVEWLEHNFLPVLDGLEAIHTHDIIHRDIKPENILMDGDTPKITDFGLARSPKLKAVSNSWDVKGTMTYMAPEQFADFRKAKIPADIYAIGKILFEAISGKLDQKIIPFKSVGLENPHTNLLKAMDGIIRKATDENRHNRYQTVPELRLDILQALKAEHEESNVSPNRDVSPMTIRWLWVGIVMVLFAVGGMAVYHLVDNRAFEQETFSSTDASAENSTMIAPYSRSSTMIANDGRKMELIENPEKHLVFYSDPSLVTFHHYAEFLNEVSTSLTVVDGVVKHDEDIWLYLGDGSVPSDQIIYRHSRFHLRQTEWAPKPVTRVTWLGAQAYAHHYGKRLPTYDEWQVIKQQFITVSDAIQKPADDSMHSHMQAGELSPNNSLTEHEKMVVKEWLSTGKSKLSSDSHVVEWFAWNPDQNVTKRYPWEGFFDVGFRTVLDAVSGGSNQ